MSHRAQAVSAVVAAGAALYVAGWFDGTVMRDILIQAGHTYDESGLMLATSLGSLAVAGSVLLFGVLAWRLKSTPVGVVYTVVGGLAAFLPVMVFKFAAEVNGNPPVLPQPIGNELNQIYVWSNGPLNAIEMVGAGICVAGIVVIGRALRGRSGSRAAEPAAEPDALAVQP